MTNPRPPLLGAANVLVVDDDPDMQELLRCCLERAGANVQIRGDGAEAVGTALGEDFDVILMDVKMPGVDGLTATAHLRSVGYTGPIVAVTACSMVGDRDRCLEAGCDAYISKPFSLTALVDTVASLRLR